MRQIGHSKPPHFDAECQTENKWIEDATEADEEGVQTFKLMAVEKLVRIINVLFF